MPVKETKDAESGLVSFTINNAADKSKVQAVVTTFGATLTHLMVLDHQGVQHDVVMGFDNPADYAMESSGNQYFGCTVGRTANRTAEGKLNLDGKPYQLTVNNGPNHLHGGNVGFDKRPWEPAIISDSAVRFTLISDHLDEGYPGNFKVDVTYEITESGNLKISYSGKLLEDQPPGVSTTVVNMTHHSYFNLSGGVEHDILDHVFWTPAGHFVPVDQNLVPTGALASCKDVPSMDFSVPRRIGQYLDQAPGGGGYDHCFVVKAPESTGQPEGQAEGVTAGEAAAVVSSGAPAGGQDGLHGGDDAASPVQMSVAARLASPTSGIVVEMVTTEPGFQLYSGNFVDSTASCKQSTQAFNGVYKYCKYSGLCIEASKFPNAVNQPEWREQVLLRKGGEYRQITEYRFSTIAPKPEGVAGDDWAASLLS